MSGPGGIHDASTLSNYLDVRVTHYDLDLAVDFEARQLVGRVHCTARLQHAASELVLDTKALDVRRVLLAGACACRRARLG
jgi:aminopeptidase N